MKHKVPLKTRYVFLPMKRQSLAIPLRVTSYTILVEVGQVKARAAKLLYMVPPGGVVVFFWYRLAKALGAHVIGTASGKGIEPP